MRIIITYLLAALAAGAPAFSQDHGPDWTHFRGSKLSGVTEETGFPVCWDDSTNITWKAEIPGRGWSSPVVYGDQVWFTTASLDGKEMFAFCTDFNTGKKLFEVKVFEPDTVYRKHAINSYATPTPCLEAGYVYVHFGRYGTACLDTRTGKILWKRTDYHCRHIQGPGSSPVLYRDLLILHFDGTDVQYLVALNKKTGETVWKSDRPAKSYEDVAENGRKAYITPLIVQAGGKDLLISNGSAICTAYDPSTGREVWWIDWGDESTIAMPAESGGLVYFYTGFEVYEDGQKHAELFAVDPCGRGEIIESNTRWRVKSPPLQLATPVVRDGLLYTIDSKSRLICMNAGTGETVWSEQLKGKYNSSPVWAAGNLYFSSTRGETFVIREGKAYEEVAVNALDGEIWATPAFLRGSILLRTSKALYRIDRMRTEK